MKKIINCIEKIVACMKPLREADRGELFFLSREQFLSVLKNNCSHYVYKYQNIHSPVKI